MFKLLLHAAIFAAGLNVTASSAHEFWIEPERYQVAPQEEIRAKFRNGENLVGVALPYFDRRSLRFERVLGDLREAVAPRSGDNPAFVWTAPTEGLLVIAHETAPSRITYKDWDKFAAFADHKGFDDIRTRHAARGLPENGFTEVYTRHVKALVAVGNGAGEDRTLGLATEFVALANPYTDDLSGGLPVRLLLDGAPRADALIEVFARDAAGTVRVTTTRTDAKGEARVRVMQNTEYFLDAVVLRPAPEDDSAVWETLWAGIGFRIPSR